MAVTRDDKANLSACLLAKQLGAKLCASVIQSQDFLDLAEAFQADVVISPRTIAASAILKFIMKSHVVSVAQIENGKAEILEIIGTGRGRMNGQQLKDAGFPKGAVIGAILKKDRVVIPRGTDTVELQEARVYPVSATTMNLPFSGRRILIPRAIPEDEEPLLGVYLVIDDGGELVIAITVHVAHSQPIVWSEGVGVDLPDVGPHRVVDVDRVSSIIGNDDLILAPCDA